MTDVFNYDYELTFGATFDETIIDNSNLPDKSTEFKTVAHDEYNKIDTVLSLHNGVKLLSTFIEHNNIKYKITVDRV